MFRSFVFLFASLIHFLHYGNVTVTLENAELLFHGNYSGQNIIVLNPAKDNHFAVKEVYVNHIRFQDEIRTQAFEIDLQQFFLKEGDTLILKIIYSPEIGIPSIYNPDALKRKNFFQFVNAWADKKTQQISWTIETNFLSESFELEHYRWDKWMTINLVQPEDMQTNNTFTTSFEPHSGRNLFRVKYIDSDGQIFYSNDIRYTSKIKEVNLISDKVKDIIEFSDSTMYQLYNQNGVLVMDGLESAINVDFLEKGKYFLNYDNKTVVINKK